MGDNSEMAGKKSSVNFDFSDIAGETTQVESIEAAKDVLQDPKAKKAEPKEKPKQQQQEKPTGYILAVPCESNQWTMKDISECSPEEFIAWAKRYYSVVTAGPDRFQSVSNKVRAFQQIVAWHQSMMRRAIRESIN